MSDEREPASGTTGGATGTAGDPPADGSAARAADGSAAALSAEELQRKLEEATQRLAETERKNQQLLSEKTNVERERAEAREALQRAGSTPPTPGAAADPFAEEMVALQSVGLELNAQLQANPNDVQLRAAAVSVATQLRSLTRQRESWIEGQRFNEMNRELAKVPRTIREEVAERIMSGEFQSVKAAQEAVEGKKSSTEAEELRKQLAAKEAEIARLRGIGPVVDVSTSLGGGTAAPSGGREITLDEWTRLQQGDEAAARKADADLMEGRIRIRY